jgi:hypothetical protein
MRIQNFISTQAVVIGFAAALFLASSAPAQEITNTEWQDRPGATEAFQPTPGAAANAAVPAAVTSEATTAAVVSQPAMAQQAVVADWTPAGGLLIGSLLACAAALSLYARKDKRVNGDFDPIAAHLERKIPIA